MSSFYDRKGNPLTVEEWGKALEAGRRVAETVLPWGGRVSTVWLGIDHNFGVGPPLVFESMVFPASSWSELECRRYSTEEDALKGHAELVQEWQVETRGPSDAS